MSRQTDMDMQGAGGGSMLFRSTKRTKVLDLSGDGSRLYILNHAG